MIKKVRQVRKLPKVVRDFIVRTSPFKVHVGLDYDKYGVANSNADHKYVAVMNAGNKGDSWDKDDAGMNIYFYGWGPTREKALNDLYNHMRFGNNIRLAVKAFTNRKKYATELAAALKKAEDAARARLEKKYPSYGDDSKNSRYHRTEYARTGK
jgi:hypothetical protein